MNMQSLEDLKQRYKYDKATPMMQQYLDVKLAHQDCLVLFRMGDFYELFFEDALEASKILGIAIAKRGKHDEEDIPMCGVPFHALDSYLNKLIEADYKIAICEQLESPEEAKKRGYKAVVKRDVVRIITPGTIVEESIVNQNEPNYLASICFNQDTCAICYIDINTSEFAVTEVQNSLLSHEIARLLPKEVLVSEKIQNIETLFSQLNVAKVKLVYQVDSYFDFKKNKHAIEAFYNIHTTDSLGNLSKNQIGAIGAILEYLKLTQKANLPQVGYPKIISLESIMQIDASTRRNLEIVKNLCGESKGSLLSIIDKTITKAGSRLLYHYLTAPLTTIEKINSRLSLTEFFINNLSLVDKIRANLKMAGDIERSLVKISMRRASPRDLLAIRDTIEYGLKIKEYIYNSVKLNLPEPLVKIFSDLGGDEEIYSLLDAALNGEALNYTNEGGYIKREYHPRVDELYSLIENSTEVVEKLRRRYQEETGIDSLKINGNNLLGLYIEVTQRFAGKITDPKFLHKQTLSNAIRYTTEELKQLESDIVNARNSVIALEQEIFSQLCQSVMKSSEKLQKLAKALSILDVFCNFAFIADEYNYTKPIIDSSREFLIKEGRHPIVERSLKLQNQSFVANNCCLNEEQRLWLITGPNMAGKSTFLRQNAHIAILAHIGSFVPASYAHIGVIDKIFSRVGAADDISKGQSTFMVEMVETSAILSQSTERSFIILDEIGRGTSTYDGVSIAWSCLEYIHDKLRCRSLFATHYHELTILNQSLNALRNYNIMISEDNGKLLLLHKIIEGAADKSYGIHVAELAGLPKSVIKRAKQILKELEQSSSKHAVKIEDTTALNLFNYASTSSQAVEELDELKDRIAKIDPDKMTPMEALQALYELKKELQEV
ncbi:MAG: mutS [Rickettsiaceae bacterium]|jgi:DNA mismatch repair protein MutS|nr:mutS [Rickettsiaceae bacterium]